jgi:hypothetical protein
MGGSAAGPRPMGGRPQGPGAAGGARPAAGGRPGFGRPAKGPELTPTVEKERVSNYDPNKQN